MSHYTVLVINTKGNEDVEAQLAPFNEHIEVPVYDRGIVSKKDIKQFVDYYTKKKINMYPSLQGESLSTEELYKLKGEDWNGGSWQFRKEGIMDTSTYNPLSKWDWYQVGGRWAGSIILKPEAEKTEEPNFSWGWSEEQKLAVKEMPRVDQARVKDIEFVNPEAFEEAMRFWELYIDGAKPKNAKEKEMIENVWYKKEFYTERYKDKITYAKCQSTLSTHSVLIDGKWLEKGEMGWFGCSSETDAEALDWELNFYDKILKSLPEEALLTVVDCHI